MKNALAAAALGHQLSSDGDDRNAVSGCCRFVQGESLAMRAPRPMSVYRDTGHLDPLCAAYRWRTTQGIAHGGIRQPMSSVTSGAEVVQLTDFGVPAICAARRIQVGGGAVAMPLLRRLHQGGALCFRHAATSFARHAVGLRVSHRPAHVYYQRGGVYRLGAEPAAARASRPAMGTLDAVLEMACAPPIRPSAATPAALWRVAGLAAGQREQAGRRGQQSGANPSSPRWSWSSKPQPGPGPTRPAAAPTPAPSQCSTGRAIAIWLD